MDADSTRQLAANAFEDETFDRLDLTGADLSGKELTRCTLRGCKLHDATWLDCRLEDCVLEGCDLTGFRAKRVALRGVVFRECKLMGADWTDVGSYPDATFADCDMRYQTFVSLALTNSSLERCAIVDSTFIDVDLTKTRFTDCDLSGTQLERCQLAGADFASSRGVYFDPAKNHARGARVSLETAALIVSSLGLVVPGFTPGKKR